MVTAEEQEVAGEEQEVEQQINLIEEAIEDYQIVPDPQEERSMVAISSAVRIYIYLRKHVCTFANLCCHAPNS